MPAALRQRGERNDADLGQLRRRAGDRDVPRLGVHGGRSLVASAVTAAMHGAHDQPGKIPAPHGPHHMLVQSMAGLAAKAVNEGRGEELVWVTSTHRDLEAWFDRFRADHPAITVAEPQSHWELLDRLREQGIVQGYILYRWDTSPGKIAEDAERPGIDMSVNVATSLAGILRGVLIDESLAAGSRATWPAVTARCARQDASMVL